MKDTDENKTNAIVKRNRGKHKSKYTKQTHKNTRKENGAMNLQVIEFDS